MKSRNRSSWPRIAATFASSVVAVEQVALGRAARTGRRSSRSRRRRARPAGRRSAGAGAARRSARGGRCGATARTGRSRCSRRSGGRSPGGPPARASWRAGCRATRARRAGPPGRVAAARSVTGSSVEPSRPTGRRLVRSFTPPMLSCGHRCRPASRGASAIDGRSRRRPKGRRGSTIGRVAVVVLIVFLTHRRSLRPVPAWSWPSAPTTTTPPACPTPRSARRTSSSSSRPVIYDRTGKIELARLGDLKRELVTFDQLPGRDARRDDRDRGQGLLEEPGFDPVGIVSAGLDTIAGRPRGASTITQQLVRARLLPAWAFEGSTYERKVREIIQSIRLTQAYPGRGRQASRSSPPT